MLQWFVIRRIEQEERRVGVPLDYVRHIFRTSRSAFRKYAMFVPMSRHRKRLPVDVFHTARLIATRREDCGTCVQIVVNLARRAGVAPHVIDDVLSGRIESLPDHLKDVYRFTIAVLEATYDEGELRERLRSRYGDEGLVELAFDIATARMFPVIKRTLGYAVSCSKVNIEV
jgi:alkylhydroperoxidase family enzyme